jgi:2-polyprenyl-3-methyl-5-hydroxy-6-metoxy-1,4-benzoquinol methylase
MIEEAREKYSGEKVGFRKGDLNRKWNLEKVSADLIICHPVLEHIKDLDSVFYQATDTLKPEGLFFISELHLLKQYPGRKARFDVDGEDKRAGNIHSSYIRVFDHRN